MRRQLEEHQAEDIVAINNLDEILTVKGIDCFMVVPGDLSHSMGPQYVGKGDHGAIPRPILARFAGGEDSRPVEPRGGAKSVSAETTFERDASDPAAMAAVLERLSARVAERLGRNGLAGRTVVLKLKTADFKLRTRSATLAAPTRRADVIARTGAALLAREADGTRFRLIGIGVANLADPDQADPPDMLESSSP